MKKKIVESVPMFKFCIVKLKFGIFSQNVTKSKFLFCRLEISLILLNPSPL